MTAQDTERDYMFQRSVPDHENMREMVTELGAQFIEYYSTVLDIGTGRGDQIARFLEKGNAEAVERILEDDVPGIEGADYIGIDISDPMLEAARRRFDGVMGVNIIKHDLREGLPVNGWMPPGDRLTLVTAVLTMMFVPVEARYRVLSDIHRHLEKDGALIMVEKVIGEGPAMDELLVGQYQAFKARQGYTDEDIERKRLSLEGVLVPLQLSSHIANLKAVGFTHVDTFWRCLNFVGIIAVK